MSSLLTQLPFTELIMALDALVKHYHRSAWFEQPDGHLDSQRRWWPSEGERQACCDRIRTPTDRFPDSLKQHCRTLVHCTPMAGARRDVVLALKAEFDKAYGEARLALFDEGKIEAVMRRFDPYYTSPPLSKKLDLSGLREHGYNV